MRITPSKLKEFFSCPEAYQSVLIYGSDYSRIDLYTQKILDRMNKGGDFAICKIDFLKASKEPEQFLVELMTVPMFYKKSLVILSDAKDMLCRTLETAVENINPERCYVIIQAREHSSASSLKAYYNDHSRFASIGCYKEDSVLNIVTDFFVANRIVCGGDALALLCSFLQNGTACIKPGLDKILLYLGEEKNLSAEDVHRIFDSDLSFMLDDVCVAIVDGNISNFLRIADVLLRNKTSPVFIIRSSIKYFMTLERLFYKTRGGVNFDTVIKSFQPPIFFRLVPQLKKHLSEISYRGVQLVLRCLFDIEAECKLADTTQEVVFKYSVCDLIRCVRKMERLEYS